METLGVPAKLDVMVWMAEPEGRWGCWVLRPRRPLSWLVPSLYLSRRHVHLFLFGLVLNYWRGNRHFGLYLAGWRPILYLGPFEAYPRAPIPGLCG